MYEKLQTYLFAMKNFDSLWAGCKKKKKNAIIRFFAPSSYIIGNIHILRQQRTGWVGSENVNFHWCSVLAVFMLTLWVGQKKVLKYADVTYYECSLFQNMFRRINFAAYYLANLWYSCLSFLQWRGCEL